MNFFKPLFTATLLGGLLLAPQAFAAAQDVQFDLACKPVRQEVTGTNSTGGAIKPFDLNDPYYTMTFSVDTDQQTYCVLTRCGEALIDFAGVFGDELATSHQRSENYPDADGDLYSVYEAINPTTKSMRLRIVYYDITSLYMVGASTLYATCTTQKFTNGGIAAAQ